MRGHEPILALRRRGLRPSSVWLSDAPLPRPLPCGTRLDWWAFREPGPAEVCIEPADNPQRLDLRFLFGLPVHVLLDDPERMRALVDAAQRAGAARVFGGSHDFNPRRQRAEETAFAAWTKEAGWLA